MAGGQPSKNNAKSGRAPVKSTPAKATPHRRSTRNRDEGKRSQTTLQQQQHGAQVSVLEEATKSTTVTTQAVHVEQSTQIVQTLLHGCLSSIAYLRSIFPQNCFSSRYYLNKSSQWSYQDYAAGTDTSSERDIVSRDGRGAAIIALKKGMSGRVDTFLNLMETGIFDSLRRGYLNSLHVTIHETPSRPLDVLESWTFTFHYQPSARTEPSTIASIDLKGTQGTTITLHQAKLSLNDFVRKLTGLCATLPALPEEKSILLHIGYTDSRPQEYFAPGFEQPATGILRFPMDEGWSKRTSEVGIINTGHHAASLSVSHLTRVSTDIPEIVPFGLDCGKEEELFNDVVKDLDKQAKALLDGPPPRAASPSDIEIVSVEEQQRADKRSLPKGSSSIILMSSKQNTQSNPKNLLNTSHSSAAGAMRLTSADKLEQERLRKMLQPPVKSSNVQETQLVPKVRDEQTTDQLIENFFDKVTLREEKVDEMDLTRTVLLDPRKDVSQVLTTYEHMLSITVGCECGNVGEEGDMIHCEFCETYQHLHCYGYLGKHDHRIPTVHACYRCLLVGERDTLMKVRDQSLHRRALWLLQQTSYTNNRLFATSLTCTDREAENVAKKLRGLGLLAPSLGASKKEKTQVTLNRSEDAKTKMMKLFFDPTFGIEHHLEKPVVDQNSSSAMPKLIAKRQREFRDEGSVLPPEKRVLKASTSGFIDGNETNTPQANRRL